MAVSSVRRLQNREAQRRSRARKAELQVTKRPVGKSQPAFSDWFAAVVLSSHFKCLLQVGPSNSWSYVLAENIEEGADPAHLRRIANGERVPKPRMTYEIGEGLRTAGLPWCSGLLSLYNHPSYRVDCYAVLDILSADRQAAQWAFIWNAGAYIMAHYLQWDMLVRRHERLRSLAKNLGLPDEDLRFVVTEIAKYQVSLPHLADWMTMATRALSEHTPKAWKRYNREGIVQANGLFGALYVMSTDVRFQRIEPTIRTTLQRDLLSGMDAARANALLHADAAAYGLPESSLVTLLAKTDELEEGLTKYEAWMAQRGA